MFPATKFGRAQNIDFVPRNKIDDDASGHAAEAFEGAPVTAQPRGDRLITHEFGILLP